MQQPSLTVLLNLGVSINSFIKSFSIQIPIHIYVTVIIVVGYKSLSNHLLSIFVIIFSMKYFSIKNNSS